MNSRSETKKKKIKKKDKAISFLVLEVKIPNPVGQPWLREQVWQEEDLVFLLFLFLFCDDVRGDSPGTACVTERGRGGGEGRHEQVGECHAVTDVIWKNRGERVEVKSWKGSGDCHALLTSCSRDTDGRVS